MKTTIMTLLKVACAVIVMLVLPAGTMAQDAGESDPATRFSKEELTQMLAPIALYPDSMIAQLLMASTYPLELVEAERWRRQNTSLQGEELDNALKAMPWDPSVKSLCHYPDVLFAMSDKLDQTRKLGDAFLGQKDEVMATVQELRRKAEQQGNLKTTSEQKVIDEQEVIQIEPVDPRVIHVPVYNPLYVYGPWWYPAYPPYYWYYPPGYGIVGGYIGFSPGIFIGFNLFSWVWFDWHTHHIHTDYYKTRRFHHYDSHRGYGGRTWQHNPVHRRGVAYRDRRTGESFGQRPPRMSPANPETRGYPGRTWGSPTWRGTQAPGERRERIGVPQTGRERSVPQGPAVRREGTVVTPRIQPGRERVQRPSGGYSPFRGVGEGTFERRAVRRGESSIRSGAPVPRSGTRGSWSGQTRQPGGGFQGGGMRQPGGGSRGGGTRR
ncbi:DUF3300 domain-containing protein [Geobacter sp.]|uniref:DUF3300 domain-containing protein n=1 Tax=Geobacter sp. TaxID=46610 RepID=UPI0027B90827|nr:DUF3300 domain-containing protein [Geobacter sp.]